MLKFPLSLALATVALFAVPVCSAATTPEGTLKEFLTAAQKKDRKVLRASVDWDGLGKTMGVDKEKDPEKRRLMTEQLRIIFVESFAMGKQADGFQIGKVTKKGDEAKGTFNRLDPATKKWTPRTEFSLHKKGKDWMIYSITQAKTPSKK
jgi:hypothetical protein